MATRSEINKKRKRLVEELWKHGYNLLDLHRWAVEVAHIEVPEELDEDQRLQLARRFIAWHTTR